MNRMLWMTGRVALVTVHGSCKAHHFQAIEKNTVEGEDGDENA